MVQSTAPLNFSKIQYYMAPYSNKTRRRWFWGLFGLVAFGVIYLYNPSDQPHVYSSRLELDAIPHQIFQTAPTTQINHPLHERLGESVQSWAMNNPDCTYTLLSDQGADDFVNEHYASQPHVQSTWANIRVPVLRADLFRYMLIAGKGGYYGDVDTTLYKSIKDWIPVEFREEVRFIVGIEYDQLDNSKPSHGFSEHISFAQWTFAASKNHPILMKIVDRVVEKINDFAKKKGTTIAKLDVPDDLVGLVTGPQIWTKAVFEGMSEVTGKNITWKDVSGITAPRLFGDILLMPVSAFGTGQPHSNAPQDIVDSTCVRHQWKMSWRHLKDDGSWEI